jgi:hypothetical protein
VRRSIREREVLDQAKAELRTELQAQLRELRSMQLALFSSTASKEPNKEEAADKTAPKGRSDETADEQDVANLYGFCLERAIDATLYPRPLHALRSCALHVLALVLLLSLQLVFACTRHAA